MSICVSISILHHCKALRDVLLFSKTAASTENGFAATIPDRRGAYTNRRTITSDTRRFSDLFESPRVPFPAFYGPRPDNTDFSESLFVTDGVGSGSVLASTKFEQSVRSAVEKAAAESIDKVKAGESVVSEAEVLVTAIGRAVPSLYALF